MRMFGRRLGALGPGGLVLAVALLVAGMAGALAPSGAVAQDDAAFQTRVRFLHANPDNEQVEVFLNGDEVLDEFQYGDLSDWIDVEPGSVRLTITADRAGFNYATFDTVYPVAAGSDIHVVLSEALVIATPVDLSPVAEGNARVRVVHASIDTPSVTVVVAGTDTALATDLGYGRDSGYIEIPAGTYDLEVQVADTGDVALGLTGVVVEAGMVYDFVAVGSPGDDDHPLTVTAIADAAETDGGAVATPVS